MSRPLRRTAFNTATIWPAGEKNEFGVFDYGDPYTVKCTFEQGSTKQYRDGTGNLYIPASIYWYEYNEDTGLPAFDDFIALGDHTDIPDPMDIDNAESIKNRVREDNSLLRDIDDVMVLT